MLSMLSLAVLFWLLRYVQVILTEVISSQYDNTRILKRHPHDRRRRTGKGGVKEGEKWGRRGRSEYIAIWPIWLCDWWAEGIQGGGRMGRKQAGKKTQGEKKKREKIMCTGQINYIVGIWDLVLNSGTWCRGSQYDSLEALNIRWTTIQHHSTQTCLKHVESQTKKH